MAATNRPETLDKALGCAGPLRPNRPRSRCRPEGRARSSPSRKKKNMASDVISRPSRAGAGVLRRADDRQSVNEAAIVAIRSGRESISTTTSSCQGPYHPGQEGCHECPAAQREALRCGARGRATPSWRCCRRTPTPFPKVTILPAGHALGVTQMLRWNERHLYPESYLADSLGVGMGGERRSASSSGGLQRWPPNDLWRGAYLSSPSAWCGSTA